MASTNENDDGDYYLIDFDSLPEKWSTFARDYFHRARDLVDAKEEYERTKRVRDVEVTEKKDALELVEAELDRDIRSNPDAYGIEKLTEAQVANTIKLQERFQEARKEMYRVKQSCEEEMAKARHAMGIHEAAVHAMDAMKKGLEAYSFLWQSSYFAEPKARGDGKRAMAEAEMDRAFSRKPRKD